MSRAARCCASTSRLLARLSSSTAETKSRLWEMDSWRDSSSATKAVQCAVALQQALTERDGEPLSVRVGLNARRADRGGRRSVRCDSDFGVSDCRRSRGRGRYSCQIPCAGCVAERDSGSRSSGEFVLKGFEDPVRILQRAVAGGSIPSGAQRTDCPTYGLSG